MSHLLGEDDEFDDELDGELVDDELDGDDKESVAPAGRVDGDRSD